MLEKLPFLDTIFIFVIILIIFALEICLQNGNGPRIELHIDQENSLACKWSWPTTNRVHIYPFSFTLFRASNEPDVDFHFTVIVGHFIFFIFHLTLFTHETEPFNN